MMYRFWDRSYDMMGQNDGWWFIMQLLPILVIVVMALILFRYLMKKESTHQAPPSPLDVAKTRLAKGEITPEEFASIRDHLQ